MIVIGLTGGIASGKSTAAQQLAKLGATVIDADRLGHRAYESGSDAFDAVVRAFGDDVVAGDGSIDRRALGAKVFGDPAALTRLTDIVWPAIRGLAQAEIAALRAQGEARVVVLEAAVLLEAGWQDLVDAIWVCVIERDLAIERASARDGVAREAIESRIDAQLSNAERIAAADVVIDNSGDAGALEKRIEELWSQLD